jgi:hypothetical protein
MYRIPPNPAVMAMTSGALALTALTLAGCSAPPGGQGDHPGVIVHIDAEHQAPVDSRLPADATPDEQFGPMLEWAGPAMLRLTTFGSSTCPDQVAELGVRDDGIQEVVLADPGLIHRACTDDLTDRQLQVPALDEALESGELTVWVRQAGESYGYVSEFSMGAPPTAAERPAQTPNAGG